MRTRGVAHRTASLLLVLAVAACSSSGAGSPTSASHSSPSTASTATTAAINGAYATFFSSSSTTAQSQAALQHGDRFTATLQAQSSSSYANRSSASVDSARLLSSDVASVTFSIRSGGSVLLHQVPGFAVRTGGQWQVAAKTFCELLKLEGDAPAACDDPSVTALSD